MYKVIYAQIYIWNGGYTTHVVEVRYFYNVVSQQRTGAAKKKEKL